MAPACQGERPLHPDTGLFPHQLEEEKGSVNLVPPNSGSYLGWWLHFLIYHWSHIFVHEWWLGRWPATPTAAPASPHPSASLVSPVLPQAAAALALPPGAVGFPKVSVRKQCLEFPCMPSALRCGSSLAPFLALKLRTAGTWGQGRAWCSPQQVGCLSGPAASLQGQGQADTARLGHAV